MNDLPTPVTLTVVIPTSGRPSLMHTLQSLIAALGSARVEILVVGSVDDSKLAHDLDHLIATYPLIRHIPAVFNNGDSSRKKNLGWKAAKTEFVAFIDDDVCVPTNWPQRMMEACKSENASIVSGPGLVPNDAGLFARLAGLTLASPAAGYASKRYRLSCCNDPILCKWSDIIGCNMAFRRDALERIGGFDPTFWPGEELLASYRVEHSGDRLYFSPSTYLYHYPRSTLKGFVQQIFGYGATRIRLLRAGAGWEWTPLIPIASVLIFLLLLISSFFHPMAMIGLQSFLVAYVLFIIGVSIRTGLETRKCSDLLIVFLIPVMHFSYGIAAWWECVHPNKDFGLSNEIE